MSRHFLLQTDAANIVTGVQNVSNKLLQYKQALARIKRRMYDVKAKTDIRFRTNYNLHVVPCMFHLLLFTACDWPNHLYGIYNAAS